MANLVQIVVSAGWLIAILFLLLPSANAAFSHRKHLAQKIDCVVCHSSASGSTKASDNLLPKAEVCQGCHTGKMALSTPPVSKQPRQSQVTKFNHQMHVRMRNIAPAIIRAIDSKTYLSDPADLRNQLAEAKSACTGCHRALPASDAVTPAAFPRMADCLVCHNNIDPPFTCTKCHDEGAALKPASHSPGWIDRHSSGKANLDKASCAVCHGRRFTCLGCH